MSLAGLPTALMQATDQTDLTPTVASAIEQGELDLLQSLDRLHSSELVLGMDGEATAMLRRCLEQQSRPYPAWAFLGYYKLGTWLLGGGRDDPSLMVQWSREICRAIDRQATAPCLITFGDSAYAGSMLWQQLTCLFQEGGDFVADLEAPGAEQLNHWISTLTAARAWIANADPELHALMQQLQRLVIAAQPGPIARQHEQSFGGATCFFFRGATLVNASWKISTAAMVELLVHEYAHAELFTLGQDQPLCLNRDDDRHHVLIRTDPRPMNGILHSLYVVSRVAETLTKRPMPANAQETEQSIDRAEIQRILEQQLRFGESSLQVVLEHARLTPKGEMIVAMAKRRLTAAAAAK